MTGAYPHSAACTHIVHNYKFCASELLAQSENKNIYVLRTDHLADDWVAIAQDFMHKIDDQIELRMKERYKTHREGKEVVVTD